MDLILVLILADVIPIALWMYYFNEKNPRTQPLKEVMSIFIFGIFSILPVVLFHRYVATYLLSQLESLHPFLAQPSTMGILQLVLILVFVALFILVFSILQALAIRLSYKLPLKESFRSTSKKLYNITPLLLFLVAFLVIEMGS